MIHAERSMRDLFSCSFEPDGSGTHLPGATAAQPCRQRADRTRQRGAPPATVNRLWSSSRIAVIGESGGEPQNKCRSGSSASHFCCFAMRQLAPESGVSLVEESASWGHGACPSAWKQAQREDVRDPDHGLASGRRICDLVSSSLDRNLYTYQPAGDQGALNALIASPVRAKYIVEHWEEMQRVASSIRHGSASASLLMRRLRAYSRQNRLATALTELGKLERTSFLLDYFQDEALRRRILIGLNKGEALHSLARQLFSGKHGELWDRAFEDQMHRASCLHLIMAAIAAWNAVYLSQAVEELKKRGEAVP